MTYLNIIVSTTASALARLQAENGEVGVDMVTARGLYDVGAVAGVRVRAREVHALYDPTLCCQPHVTY